ncbi:MAG: glycerol kinase GlpK [Actinomycetota bacterium]|nr:glycerol kinase GlpK [Actinomycetota bacterium]
MRRLLAIDAGTTGVTALVIDERGRLHARGYQQFPQHFPQPGWVEHDPEQIWQATLAACDQALQGTDLPAGQLAGMGITNQRETTVLWRRDSLRPVHNAIVWQDRRTADACEALRDAGHAEMIRQRTGLVVDPYFSGTKLAWLLDHVEGARDAAQRGELAFGTVDSWLIARLTAGRVHITEPSNASRTMLFDLRERTWSEELCALLDVPSAVLPELRPTAGELATTEPEVFFDAAVPVTAAAGDQQAALFGHGCWEPGSAKNTYGTGSFVLLNTGSDAPASERLVTTIAWDLGDVGGGAAYALEGSIFVTGAALQWLREGLGLIAEAEEAGALAGLVDDTGDVFLVPAFTGLGAPHWDPRARGTIVGLTRGTTRSQLVRAAVEAMAYQTRDVVDAMRADSDLDPRELRVDGGAAAMDLLCQLQAALLRLPVLRPAVAETTGMGAGYLAGLGAGLWGSTGELAELWELDRRFEPAMAAGEADARQARWRQALERSRGWAAR